MDLNTQEMENAFATEHVGTLLKSAFELLWFSPEGLFPHELFERMQETHPLTKYDLGNFDFAAHLPRYEVVIRVGFIPLLKAGWLSRSNNGRICITEAGREKARHTSRAEDFFHEATATYETWKKKQDQRSLLASPIIRDDAQETAFSQFSKYLLLLEPSEIKALVAKLYSNLGYKLHWLAPSSKKKGRIDLILGNSAPGFGQPKVYVHIKHSGQALTAEGLNDFAAAIPEQDYGIIFCSSGFTSTAREEAFETYSKKIELIDLEDFYDLWIKSYKMLDHETAQILPVKAVYFLSLDL